MYVFLSQHIRTKEALDESFIEIATAILTGSDVIRGDVAVEFAKVPFHYTVGLSNRKGSFVCPGVPHSSSSTANVSETHLSFTVTYHGKHNSLEEDPTDTKALAKGNDDKHDSEKVEEKEEKVLEEEEGEEEGGGEWKRFYSQMVSEKAFSHTESFSALLSLLSQKLSLPLRGVTSSPDDLNDTSSPLARISSAFSLSPFLLSRLAGSRSYTANVTSSSISSKTYGLLGILSNGNAGVTKIEAVDFSMLSRTFVVRFRVTHRHNWEDPIDIVVGMGGQLSDLTFDPTENDKAITSKDWIKGNWQAANGWRVQQLESFGTWYRRVFDTKGEIRWELGVDEAKGGMWKMGWDGMGRSRKAVFEGGKRVSEYEWEGGVERRRREYGKDGERSMKEFVWNDAAILQTFLEVDGDVQKRQTYKYGKISTEHSWSNGVDVYDREWDSSGEMIRETLFDQNGNISSFWRRDGKKQTKQIRSHGALVQEVTWENEIQRISREYDPDSGKMIKEDKYDVMGNMETSWKVDGLSEILYTIKNGKPVSEHVTSGGRNRRRREWDQNEKLIKEMIWDAGGSLSFVWKIENGTPVRRHYQNGELVKKE